MAEATASPAMSAPRITIHTVGDTPATRRRRTSATTGTRASAVSTISALHAFP